MSAYTGTMRQKTGIDGSAVPFFWETTILKSCPVLRAMSCLWEIRATI